MPNRKQAWVNLDLKARIKQMPCAICGRPDDIEVDHIVSIANGGNSDPSNLQPLCRTCNSIKGPSRTNAEVSAWISIHAKKFKRSQDFRTKRLALIRAGDWR